MTNSEVINGQSNLSPCERILRTILLEETDRAPVTLFGINPFLEDWRTRDQSYERLLSYAMKLQDTFALTYIGDPNFTYFLQANKEIHDPYIWYGVGDLGVFFSASEDIQSSLNHRRKRNSTFFRYEVNTPKGELRAIYRVDDGVASTWQVEPLIKKLDDIDKVLSVPYEPLKPDLSKIREKKKELGSKAIVTISIGDPVGVVVPLFRYERFLSYAIREKSKIMELLDTFHERLYGLYKRLSEEVDDVLFRIWGPEYVTPPAMAPRYFKEFVLRYDEQFVDVIQKNRNFACVHCHGPLKRVIKDIASMNPSVLDPVEPPPKGDMSLADLKKEVGDSLCLLGYVELQDLEAKKPKEIDGMIKRIMEKGAPGGGYILGPSATPIRSISKRVERNLIQFLISGNRYGTYAKK